MDEEIRDDELESGPGVNDTGPEKTDGVESFDDLEEEELEDDEEPYKDVEPDDN